MLTFFKRLRHFSFKAWFKQKNNNIAMNDIILMMRQTLPFYPISNYSKKWSNLKKTKKFLFASFMSNQIKIFHFQSPFKLTQPVVLHWPSTVNNKLLPSHKCSFIWCQVHRKSSNLTWFSQSPIFLSFFIPFSRSIIVASWC